MSSLIWYAFSVLEQNHIQAGQCADSPEFALLFINLTEEICGTLDITDAVLLHQRVFMCY